MEVGLRPEAHRRASKSPSRLQLLAIRPSRTRDAFHAVRHAILTGELLPGSLHSVAELAAKFGVSRTPVREALIELASLGMVQFERNRGFRILRRSVHDLEEIFELRLLLEVPTTRRAAERMDPATLRELQAQVERMREAARAGDEQGVWDCDSEFHRTLLAPANNALLIRYIDTLRDLTRLLGASNVGRTRTLFTVVGEHETILEPIVGGDPNRAAEAMRQHLLDTAKLLIAQEGERMGEILQPPRAP